MGPTHSNREYHHQRHQTLSSRHGMMCCWASVSQWRQAAGQKACNEGVKGWLDGNGWAGGEFKGWMVTYEVIWRGLYSSWVLPIIVGKVVLSSQILVKIPSTLVREKHVLSPLKAGTLVKIETCQAMIYGRGLKTSQIQVLDEKFRSLFWVNQAREHILFLLLHWVSVAFSFIFIFFLVHSPYSQLQLGWCAHFIFMVHEFSHCNIFEARIHLHIGGYFD